MNEKELAEQLKFSSPKELYIVTWDNQLKLLKCPFRVLVCQNIGILKKGLIVVVSEVKVTAEMKTVFIIKNNAYYYYYFDFVL